MEKNWYDRWYKKFFILTIIFFAVALIYLGIFYHANGDIIKKDVSLTGGTTVTVFDNHVNIADLKASLSPQFPGIVVREVSQFDTGQQTGFFVETKAQPKDIEGALENYLGYNLTSENSSVQFTGSQLSAGFYQQLRFAIILAFVFMAAVVFLVFRTPVPSIAVVVSAFGDIIMPLAVMDFFGVSFSMAGVIAFLMLVGYSVDTDILLTSRLLKTRKGDETVNSTIYKAMKTGLTMTLTSIGAVGISLLIIFNLSDTLRQIFTVLIVGLVFDMFNTWITNASLLKWYVERKK